MEETQLVCASPQMREISETVRMSRGRTLLLTGETGVGKDALARWAHSISPYADGPFADINCAAIQDPLWESEIFGHAKGAFTGAVTAKPGQVEESEGGSLFLNEIGDMPLSTQAKLLTFLDVREFQRLGETVKRTVNTRVIAATNRDLERAVDAGQFRRDLFFRLANVHVHIPPLCERPEDILALAWLHLRRLTRRRKLKRILMDESTRSMLVHAPWKGNTRELFSVMETAFERCVEAQETILLPRHFALEFSRIESAKTQLQNNSAKENGDGSDVRETGSGSYSDPADPLVPSIPDSEKMEGTILDRPELLEELLDRLRTPSGRWNISVAHRLLVQSGKIRIGRRAFADRIKRMFPDA